MNWQIIRAIAEKDLAEVQKNRIAVCQKFSTDHHCFLVLKGYRTLIADPESNVYVNHQDRSRIYPENSCP